MFIEKASICQLAEMYVKHLLRSHKVFFFSFILFVIVIELAFNSIQLIGFLWTFCDFFKELCEEQYHINL